MESLLQTLDRIQTRVDSEWPTILKKDLMEGRISLDMAASEIRAHGFTVSAFDETLLRCGLDITSRLLDDKYHKNEDFNVTYTLKPGGE